MKITINRDKHKYFALKPTKCWDCGKHFFLEMGSCFWSAERLGVSRRSHIQTHLYHCKDCTRKRKEKGMYCFDYKKVE